MHGVQVLSTVLLGALTVSAACVARQESTVPTTTAPATTVQTSTPSNSTLPTFCTALDPPPSAEELEFRSKAFAHAFIVTKNLEEAFSYISGTTYINHNPLAENGAAFAYTGLSQVFPIATLTAQRHTFQDPQTWLGYNAVFPGANESTPIVDRFRWEAGCIVEHWDAGEVYPGDNITVKA